MEWSKLKNIILLILLITNGFLLYFVVREAAQEYRFQASARENAIAFLEGKGVQVAQEQVPRRIGLQPQTARRDLERESALAAALLGGTVRAEARGSEVYRYWNDSGWLQFHSDGAFSAQFTPGTFPVEADREQAGLALLKGLDFAGELLDRTENTLVFRQLWQDAPLFTQQVTLVFDEGSIIAATGGRRLVGEPERDQSREPITVATALIDLFNGLNDLGDVCSEISAIREGYVASAALSGSMSLTPVWHITTDTGTYQLNTLTGGLTRTAG